jgi:hypothetical protein
MVPNASVWTKIPPIFPHHAAPDGIAARDER